MVGNNLQAIFGTRSENLKTDMETYLRTGGTGIASQARALVEALGGAGNVERAEACAVTRVRVIVKESSRVSDAALEAAGVRGVMRLPGNTLHLIIGDHAAAYAADMRNICDS